MKKTEHQLHDKASVSLSSLIAKSARKARLPSTARLLGISGGDPEIVTGAEHVAVQIEASDQLGGQLQPSLARDEELGRLDEDGEFWTGRIAIDHLPKLLNHPLVQRVQSKKRSEPTLNRVFPAIGISKPGGARIVQEDGRGVLIGIVDSGFDLSHPMFRDSKNRLRVAALLDQTTSPSGHEYDTAALERLWANHSRPGQDDVGHGTHVASIAGGTRFAEYEGIAPGVQFLLVKTNLVDTDKAVAWIFNKAGSQPCVVNMSFGHHFGSHDGTQVEERLHRKLAQPGRVIVVAAGNEREDSIHFGGRFVVGRTEEIPFSVLEQSDGEPGAIMTLWYAEKDVFKISLLTPWGQDLLVPVSGKSDAIDTSTMSIELSRNAYPWSHSTQVQIELDARQARLRPRDLRGWKIRIQCERAAIGRLDAWFSKSHSAVFGDHRLVEEARTISLPATGDGCIAVASFVSAAGWNSDAGQQGDESVVVGRISPFSSLGPTRNGREKPEIGAPGEYVTAALAQGSQLSGVRERALVAGRLLTIEGTSMAAPTVTGVVALMLQKNPRLDVDHVRNVLRANAVHDAQTGHFGWSPAYGFGKIDVPRLLHAMGGGSAP